MKTLYSSTFLSAIFGFLILLDQSGKPIEVRKAEPPVFRTIVARPDLALPEDAKTHVTIFTSFICEGCQAFGLGNVKSLGENYHKNENFTLHLNLIPNQESEADQLGVKAAYCAGEQGKLWDMVVKLYEMEAILPEEVALKAEETGLDMTKFDACLKGEAVLSRIEEAIAEKQVKKIKTLPTTLINSTQLTGAQPMENIEREIRRITKD